MELQQVALVMGIVLFGSYVQTVAGFAMGMILVALIGGLRLLDIPTLAAMVSLLSGLNALVSLRGAVRLRLRAPQAATSSP